MTASVRPNNKEDGMTQQGGKPKIMSNEQIEEAFVMFALETTEAREAASFQSLNYTPTSCVVSVYQMGDQEA